MTPLFRYGTSDTEHTKAQLGQFEVHLGHVVLPLKLVHASKEFLLTSCSPPKATSAASLFRSGFTMSLDCCIKKYGEHIKTGIESCCFRIICKLNHECKNTQGWLEKGSNLFFSS